MQNQPHHQPGKKNRRLYWILAILSAFLIHLAFIPLLIHELESKSVPSQRPFKTRFLASADRIKPSLTSKKLDKRPPLIPEKGQIVDLPPSEKKERPQKADYLSEHNNVVDHETKASRTSPYSPNISAEPLEGADERSPHAGSSAPHVSKPGEEGGSSLKTPSLAEQEGAQGSSETGTPGRQNKKPGPKGEEGLPNLIPSIRDAGKFAGMPFNDHLPEVEEDAATRLNTWEWKHAAFFNRIKERVAREWDPRTPIRRFDPQAVMIGKQNRITVIHVTIDNSGNVVKALVEKASGVYYLDEEALRAFRASGPFQNPPSALFTQQGTFSFNFGFFLSNEGRGGLDFNWAPN